MPQLLDYAYPINLICTIKNTEDKIGMPDHIDERMNRLLARLSERDKYVVKLRYEQYLPYSKIGKILGVTLERVRQIDKKILKKLRHPSRIKYLTWEMKDIIAAEKNKPTSKPKQHYHILFSIPECKNPRFLYFNSPLRKYMSISNDMADLTIDYLGLSVRAYNIMRRNNVATINDLLNFSIENLMQIKHAGSRIQNEILSKISQYCVINETLVVNKMNSNQNKAVVQRNASCKSEINTKIATIAELNLSTRARNVLQKQNITTIDELSNMSDKDLMRMQNAGEKTRNEIRHELNKYHQELSQNDKSNVALGIQYREKPIFSYLCLSKDIRNKNIECLGLSTDIIDFLHSQNVITINDLIKKSLNDLSGTQNINPITCNLIIPKLINYTNNKGE